MDHLPDFGASEAIEVPYVGTEDYDGGDFSGYPERKGWDKGLISRRVFPNRTDEEVAAFLQTWLYFGLLFDILQAPVNTKDFLSQKGDGRLIVVTERLPLYVHNWLKQFNPLEVNQDMYLSIRRRLGDAQRFVIIFCDTSTREKSMKFGSLIPSLLKPEICLSIMVLADSLTKAGLYACGISLGYSWGVSELLTTRMLAAGWCRSVMTILSSTGQIQMQYYASTLGKPAMQKDHSNCSEFTCAADQIDNASYQTKHRTSTCTCMFVEPPQERVIEILQRGAVPLITCSDMGVAVPLRVVEHEGSQESPGYVAFSHVWADGLGNATLNALPICQLQHLQHLANELHGPEAGDIAPTPFWIDTLCVPVGQAHRQYRKQAIKQMAYTYKAADKVLVLDSSLLSASRDSPALELYTRIKLSRWMRRLWTLQEGILGKDTFFQFRDGARRSNDIHDALHRELEIAGQNRYTRFDTDARAVLRPFLHSPPAKESPPITVVLNSHPSSMIKDIWRSVEWRSTSHRADETICLATLLGIDQSPLLEIPETDYDKRMIQFFRLMNSIPKAFLFQPPPQLSVKGFRWAPTSLLAGFRGGGVVTNQDFNDMANIHPSGNGLLLSQPGLLLDASGGLLPYEDIASFTLRVNSTPTHLLAVTLDANLSEGKPPNTFDSGLTRYPALLLSTPIPDAGLTAVIFGALVFLEDRDSDGLLHAAYYGMVSIQSAFEEMLMPAPGGKSYIGAEVLASDQKWLLS